MEHRLILQELNLELEQPIPLEELASWDIKKCPGEAGSVTVKDGKVELRYSVLPHFCRLVGLVSGSRGQELREEPRFEELSLMVDCSRNAVPKVATLKKLIRRMALMGYHALLLYTEDTYEIENYPYFGYMRGRYTREELREIDDYAALFGIEIIPCIQTLAHLNAIFHWQAFRNVRDTKDILLCDDEQSDALIRQMIRSCASCFRSRKIHVGMDEAEMLGRGEFLNRHGFEERHSIFLRHLNRVTEICREYGLEPMMWSDMFIKDLRQYPQSEYPAMAELIRRNIPEDMALVCWDYYARSKEKYDRSLAQHQQLSENLRFAGGAWRWSGFAPLLDHSMQVSRLSLASCLEFGITRVMVTAWGDDGGECDLWTILPVLQLYAEVCYSGRPDVSEERLAERMQAVTGISYRSMMLTSLLNYVPHNAAPGKISSGPAKYYLYQDPMMGLFDRHVDPELCPAHYRRCAELLHDAAETAGRDRQTFDTLAKLALVLQHKCDYGIRLKKAYDAGDRAALKALSDEANTIAQLVGQFRDALYRQWMTQNKAQGFEVLDIRLGGLIRRLHTTAETVSLYLSGEYDCIEELQEQKLYFEPRKEEDGEYPILENCLWREMVTACEI